MGILEGSVTGTRLGEGVEDTRVGMGEGPVPSTTLGEGEGNGDGLGGGGGGVDGVVGAAEEIDVGTAFGRAVGTLAVGTLGVLI